MPAISLIPVLLAVICAGAPWLWSTAYRRGREAERLERRLAELEARQ